MKRTAILILAILLTSCAHKMPDGIITADASHGYYLTEPSVLYRDGFRMWAHALDNRRNCTIYLTSPDGKAWESHGRASSTNIYRTCVLRVGDEYLMYGVDVPDQSRISLYTSPSETGFAFRAVCIEADPDSWDTLVANSYVWQEDRWYMLYDGWIGDMWWTGLAVSPDGIAWQKLGPITLDAFNVGSTASINCVWKEGEVYHGLLHGNPRSKRLNGDDIYLIRSANLLEWELVRDEPYIAREYEWEGIGDDTEGQVADAWILDHDGTRYIYYEGISSQRPDKHKPHRIGLVIE